MSDIIQLLPDSVANQIAAGEVIQRPASVVKELVENAVDAGSDEISVVVKEAGRTLIQVTDNGLGMSDSDARLAFERHATSKIRNANDLFGIRTKGFRGEALASIAAIARVVMKTRQPADETGTEIIINGSEFEHQIPVSCAPGTNFSIKNLFFNVPARRKFLKSNTTELKHIINEFQRIALTHPEISFNLVHNESVIYNLPESNLRQRIVHIFGKSMNSNLNNLETQTNLVNISGFIGKPESAKKTTGEQYFFVNQRYMRHPYFHRAIMKAYENILPPDTYPGYFIFLDADPKTIDVNIHPTKTEIKFENEQVIFRILMAAIKEALGKSNAMPSIDFDTQGVVDIPVLSKDTEIKAPEIEIDTSFNPFEQKSPEKHTGSFKKESGPPEGWEALYADSKHVSLSQKNIQGSLFEENTEDAGHPYSEYIQLKNKYIVTPVKSGLMLIDQKLAHERILFEQFIQSVAHNQNMAQRELYPEKMDLDPEHYILALEIKDELASLGIEISDLGSSTIVVNSCPAVFECSDLRDLIDELLEEYKQNEQKIGQTATKAVAASLARAASIDYGRSLQNNEMQRLVDELFACEDHNYSPTGKKIIAIMQLDEIEKLMR